MRISDWSSDVCSSDLCGVSAHSGCLMHQRRLENKAQTGESRRMDHQARQDAPRQRIIKAARKLFDAKGFHATTTAELATEAAVSIGPSGRAACREGVCQYVEI